MKEHEEYYKILGLNEGASLEEITGRWIELKKQFQSGPMKGNETDKTMEEINKAYQILKDSVSRPEFDLEQYLKKSILSRRAERRRSQKKKIILSSAVLGLCLLIGATIFISQRPQVTIQSKSATRADPYRKTQGAAGKIPPLESKTPLKAAKVVPQEPSKAFIPESAQPVPAPKEPPVASITPPTPPILETPPPVEVAKVVPQEPSKTVIPESAQPVPKEVGRVEAPQPTPKEPPTTPPILKTLPPVEVAKVAPQEPSKAVIAESAQPAPIPKETPGASITIPPVLKTAPPVEVAKVVPREPSNIVVPESPKIPEGRVQKEQVASLPPPPSAIASDQEVRQFFESYVNQYSRKDLGGFISFFSAKAIQNQKDDYGKIKKIYDLFFEQMETIRYQIAIGKIEPRQNSLEVKGQYQLEGIVAKGRKKQTWKGQVRWVLVREEGDLKILSLDYQTQK